LDAIKALPFNAATRGLCPLKPNESKNDTGVSILTFFRAHKTLRASKRRKTIYDLPRSETIRFNHIVMRPLLNIVFFP